MVELSGNPEETKGPVDAAQTADLVIGLVDPRAGENLAETLSVIQEAVSALAKPVETLVLYKSGLTPNPAEAELQRQPGLRLLSYAAPPANPGATLAQSLTADYRAIAGATENLNARSYAFIASDLETVTPQWIYYLSRPVLEQNFDVVTPSYVFHKFEAIINNSILYPLTRSLYGKRIRNPLGPDVGISSRFMRTVLSLDTARGKPSTSRVALPVGPEAASRNYPICEANLGNRKNPPIDWKNLSSLLADVLGPVFLAMDRDAPLWQRVRGSEPVPVIGDPLPYAQETVAVDVRRLIEPFQLGFRSLQEIWGLVLPPKTLFELQRLARMTTDQFRMPDELWVRIVYDFSLGYHLRTISRDHLLRALTPLYLGWVASYALEAEHLSAYEAHHRLERLCEAYEAGKPYLVSRWRWPDRFNP